jgi:adenine-specific DNA-methyltransferase
MPTLNWIGKDKVINHHQDVPFRVLDHQYGYTPDGKQEAPVNSGNLIIHGDNLEALKSLLPQYEAKVKCIYIDPPYNTGNEGWAYNDNVNDPKIKKWLHQVVGKEGEDLSRHDKWLCMMYPRILLLHRLLAEKGIIFVSIDNFEFNYLSLLLEEIFGRGNCIESLIWKKSYGGGAKSKYIVNLHEYVYCYAKNIAKIPVLELPPDDSILKYYKYQDSKFETRGPYRLQPLATTSMDARPNLRYPIVYNGDEIWPEKQWQWSQQRTIEALNNDELVIDQKKGKWSVNYKQYLKDAEGTTRGSKLYSVIEGIYTQQGTAEFRKIFQSQTFTFPKPSRLIQMLIQLTSDKEALILDSFAGSGTTAHAVLNLNKQDGGNRKFILVEMEDYAETITAERVKRVINGYADVEGTGGSFDYYEIGPPLFDDGDNLNEQVPVSRIREYIWYSETRSAFHALTADQLRNPYFLGIKEDTGYYFYYEPQQVTTLDYDFLGTISLKAEQYVVYADNCLLSKTFLQNNNIIFKKIPRDISRL